jgi:hypothetical protein
MWEKKDNMDGVSDLSNPHDADNLYKWSSSGSAADGTLFMDFLSKLNNTCDGAGVTACDGICTCGLAGHTDWRIPNIKELQSIVDYGRSGPASSVPGSTVADGYWSSTSFADNPLLAWSVHFSTGNGGDIGIKNDSDLHARAVRGGS